MERHDVAVRQPPQHAHLGEQALALRGVERRRDRDLVPRDLDALALVERPEDLLARAAAEQHGVLGGVVRVCVRGVGG